MVKNTPVMQETTVQSLGWVGRSPRRRDSLPTPVFLGFPGGSDVKYLATIWETWARFLYWKDPQGGHDNPLNYSCLENPHGERRLADYSPWGHKELDRTE